MPVHRLKKKKKKLKKRTARIICRNGKEFWTTQKQFWQWVRDRVVTQVGEHPSTGVFIHENQEYMVLLDHTILNLAHPNHLSEALYSRRLGIQ